MTKIRTTIINGRIEFVAPLDIPEGADVIVEVCPVAVPVGVDESQWNNSPEGIAEWINWYERLEPLLVSEAEVSALVADGQSELAEFNNYADKLARQWE